MGRGHLSNELTFEPGVDDCGERFDLMNISQLLRWEEREREETGEAEVHVRPRTHLEGH